MKAASRFRSGTRCSDEQSSPDCRDTICTPTSTSRWIFRLGKLQAGYVRHFRATKGLVPGIGGTLALSLLAPELAPHYSSRVAPTLGVFFSLQAAKHEM